MRWKTTLTASKTSVALNVLEKLEVALAGVAQWIECHPTNQGVAGSIPSQGSCLGCEPDSLVRGMREATTH